MGNLSCLSSQHHQRPSKLRRRLELSSLLQQESRHRGRGRNEYYFILLGRCLLNDQVVEHPSFRQIHLEFPVVLNMSTATALANGIVRSKVECLQLEGEIWVHCSDEDEPGHVRRVLYEAIGSCSTIRHLTLTKVPSANVADGLGPALALMHSLQTLEIKTLHHGEDSRNYVKLLTLVLIQTTSITKLRIFQGYSLFACKSSIMLLGQALQRNATITDLAIDHCEIGKALPLLLEHWRPNHGSSYSPSLQRLSLQGNEIDMAGAQLLGQALLRDHPALQRVNLCQNNNIGYQGLALLGRELLGRHAPPHLIGLDISACATLIFCWDDDCNAKWIERAKSLQVLLEVVKQNVHMTELVLEGYFLSPHINYAIAFYLARNSKCQYLLSTDDHTTEGGLSSTVWCYIFGPMSW